MNNYTRPIFGSSGIPELEYVTDDSKKIFTDTQTFSATVAATAETLLGNIEVPQGEDWILTQIWCSGTGGEYRLNIGSFTDATCDYNDSGTADPTVTCDANTLIKVNQGVSGSLIPTGAYVSEVTEGGGAGTGVTTFELNESTGAGSAVSNGTLTFTENQAMENFTGKFIQNSDEDSLKSSRMYPIDICIRGRNVLGIYITNNASTSTVCKANIQYKRYISA